MSEHLTTDLELAEAMLANEIASSASVGRGNGNSEPALYGVAALASGDAVLQRLQTHLLGWFGPDGVDALLIRGLDRATAAHPILAAVQRPRGGALRLEGILDSADATGTAGTARNGRCVNGQSVNDAVVALVAAVLELIGRLVGDDMMRHLVNQIWPQLPFEQSPSDGGVNNKRDTASE